MADMWSDDADVIIKGVDGGIKAKYKFSLTDFLTEPANFASTPNIQIAISNMKETVDSYAAGLLDGLEDEKRSLNDDAMRCDSITSQLSQEIRAEAKQNRIPILKPAAVMRDENRDEVIVIKEVSGDVLGLIGRLVGSSLMIADFTRQYNNYSIGEWLFSGSKNYVVRVGLDANPVINIESAMGEIDTLLDTAATYIKSLAPAPKVTK